MQYCLSKNEVWLGMDIGHNAELVHVATSLGGEGREMIGASSRAVIPPYDPSGYQTDVISQCDAKELYREYHPRHVSSEAASIAAFSRANLLGLTLGSSRMSWECHQSHGSVLILPEDVSFSILCQSQNATKGYRTQS